MPKLVDTLVQEAAEFQKRQQKVQKIFDQYDLEFEEWKERVLQFEHSEYSADDNSVSDDWICDGECMGESESESGARDIYQKIPYDAEEDCEGGANEE